MFDECSSPKSPDGEHCSCWPEVPCCWCDEPPLTPEEDE